ncbi:hypothetical protein SCHPADRAFT_921364 [Schizopora paradoxa]|uniref:AB hydrolase-1 domain-containing protein n=1 Tax=Schizopora paradoxa TaxID=27342 RepID=A0A0H2S6N9_9AGAM|nr:hypothetical protein SCHPADRAFT_921364 [Schizopora paradoxa]
MASTSSLNGMLKSKRRHERPTKSRALKSVNPRTLKPSVPPPDALLLYPPVLPAGLKPRSASSQTHETHQYFDVSTHIVPAAYPRLTPYVSFSELERRAGGFAGAETKESRSLRAKQISEQLSRLRENYAKGKLVSDGSENRLLWNVVNRYSRKGSLPANKTRVTLLLAHANGFPKETWEPFLVQLCKKLEGQDVFVDEAWAIEAVQHGDSCLINQEKLGVLFDWSDHSRDLLNFLLRYLPDSSASAPPHPVHLPRLPEEVGLERIKSGLAGRTLIAIGHSFGGCTSTLAAVNAPNLFSSLVLVDPVIVPQYNDRTSDVLHLARGAVQRRETWSSREEAHTLFRSSPFFGAWDPKVLELYVEHGLAAEDNGVRLKMPGLQESVVFVDMQVSYETFELLDRLDDKISLLWVLATKGHKLNGPEDERYLVWRRPANCENVCIESSGHLIAQEAPTELAHEIMIFLFAKYARGSDVRRSNL